MAHYLLGLCAALMNEQVPVAVRQLGGIQIKNAISAKSEAQRQRVALRWMSNVPDDVKNNIKQMVALLQACHPGHQHRTPTSHTNIAHQHRAPNIMRVSVCVHVRVHCVRTCTRMYA